jgi:hypothetical protein
MVVLEDGRVGVLGVRLSADLAVPIPILLGCVSRARGEPAVLCITSVRGVEVMTDGRRRKGNSKRSCGDECRHKSFGVLRRSLHWELLSGGWVRFTGRACARLAGLASWGAPRTFLGHQPLEGPHRRIGGKPGEALLGVLMRNGCAGQSGARSPTWIRVHEEGRLMGAVACRRELDADGARFTARQGCA